MTRVIFLALLVTSCTQWRRDAIPIEGDRIKVPHDKHAKSDVSCLTCHEEIYDQKSLEARVLPPEDKCMECHREWKDKGECNKCHTDVRKAQKWPAATPALRLDHAAHIERTKEKCETCHTTLPNPLRTIDGAPKMAACLGCHEHKQEFAASKCDGCHLDLRRHALKPNSFFSHQGNFVKEHSRQARASADSCATCHEQTFCKDCHSAQTVPARIEVIMPERVDRDFIHRNDFLGRHQVEAAADQASCRRCHGQSFCDDCHRAQNLTPFGTNPRDPHPLGWSFPGSPNFHGPAARRDIVRCAACHDQGARSICVDCHKVGGIGGNPHPPGWNRSRNEISSNGMCLTCHL